MATFEAQVEGLTSLSIGTTPTTSELTQFLTDGAKEVINQLPGHLLPLCSSSISFTSGSASTLNTGKILNVFRSDGDINQPCRKIPAKQKGRVSDPEDMAYATITDPVFFIDNNTLDVFPSGGSCTYSEVQYPSVNYSDSSIGSTSLTTVTATAADPTVFTKSSHGLSTGDVVELAGFQDMTEINGMTGTVTKLDANTFEVNGISADPAETRGGNVTKLGAFPDEAEHLVVLYGAIKSIQNVLGNLSDTIDSDTRFISFEDFFNLAEDGNPFGDNDPGVFSVSEAPPVPPSSPSYSTPAIQAITVGTMPTISSVSISNVGVPPTYTSPTITSTAGSPNDLTDMIDSDWSSLDYDFDDENIDFATWFQVLGDMIQNQEDTELASAQVQKISTYLRAYQEAMTNNLNTYNKENVAYQAKLQEAIQQAQINSQRVTQQSQIDKDKVTQQSQIDAQDAQQEASLKLQKEQQEYQAKLSKFSNEVQSYQAKVNKEVQEYGQKFSKYQFEVNTAFQAWSKTVSDSLQKFSSEYGWWEKQQAKLQADYDKGIGQLAGN
tara:strand:- start:615 stop:2267 length:1653 start_codon:yes stop_codon:yes gene_type:complete